MEITKEDYPSNLFYDNSNSFAQYLLQRKYTRPDNITNQDIRRGDICILTGYVNSIVIPWRMYRSEKGNIVLHKFGIQRLFNLIRVLQIDKDPYEHVLHRYCWSEDMSSRLIPVDPEQVLQDDVYEMYRDFLTLMPDPRPIISRVG